MFITNALYSHLGTSLDTCRFLMSMTQMLVLLQSSTDSVTLLVRMGSRFWNWLVLIRQSSL